MRFEVKMFNELPFMVELKDGDYRVKTDTYDYKFKISSDYYKLIVAPFPEKADDRVYYGDKEELLNIVVQNQFSNYAFSKSKTFIETSIIEEVEIADNDIEQVSDEEGISQVTTQLLINKVKYNNTEELNKIAKEYYNDLNDEEKISLKLRVYQKKRLNRLVNIYDYYDALNRFIELYSYTRKLFWIEKLNENTLEGTQILQYVDGKYFDTFRFGGLAPSIITNKKLFPDLTDDLHEQFHNRLDTGFEVPIDEKMLIVARSLWYRCEYRSAIIESSAALEIAVEKKLVEKMKVQGISQSDIEKELAKTETNFRQRCDVFLKKYTGKSFEHDNNALWIVIDNHRKNYRHKIAHSDVIPDKEITETIIKDFEEAIQYINSL
ncbi:hypothetical protein [Dethiothermospora halolimnae]|uniref:hypothetical protein n=1 Tax=Dethiothermospora halolimnae TaxID=3114390 RepID=UPI003CCC0E16